MTISLLMPSITDAISQVTVSGVSMKDADEISASFAGKSNVFYPNPEGFITGFRVANLTFPRGASEKADVSYTLNYRFLGTQIGDLGNMPKAYGDMLDKLMTLLNAILATDAPYSGAVDMTVGNISVGARSDPAGNMYHGADVALNITEMQNP